MNQHPHIIEALRELGVQIPADFEAIQRAPTLKQAQKMLADLKDRARRNFRKLAFELHPDRTGGDNARTEHFMILSKAKEELDKIQLQPIRRRPPPPPVSVSWVRAPAPRGPAYVPTNGMTGSVYTAYYTSATSTTTSTMGNFDPFRVVIMRPF